VKLLQVRVVEALSPAASHPFLTPEQSAFLLIACSPKYSSPKTLVDGPATTSTETHFKTIHKRHFSRYTPPVPLAGAPHSA